MFGKEGDGSTAEGGCWGCARVTAGRREMRREGFIAFFLGREQPLVLMVLVWMRRLTMDAVLRGSWEEWIDRSDWHEQEVHASGGSSTRNGA